MQRFSKKHLKLVEKQQLYSRSRGAIESKSRVKPVGEQRSNLPNDTDVSYYSWL
jgi:hypothetical protein